MRLADVTILTAEDPRTESLELILAQMAEGAARAGGVEGATFFRIPDRTAAIQAAVDSAQPGDVVLVCGKGHEQSMCFGAVEHPWRDQAVVRLGAGQAAGPRRRAAAVLASDGGRGEHALTMACGTGTIAP